MKAGGATLPSASRAAAEPALQALRHDAFFAEDLNGVCVPEYLNVLHAQYAILHRLGCAHFIASHQHGHLLAKLCQVARFFTGCITGSNDHHILTQLL